MSSRLDSVRVSGRASAAGSDSVAARRDGSIERITPAGCVKIADATKWASCRGFIAVRSCALIHFALADSPASTDALPLGQALST
ncbi:hypothetical protein [Kibdelosporangium phytohabitans]|uniref:hypothetical protein n=1 Tax=Kibdelosporangium phytohabitans TaxID=860235 RepID=UPI0009F8D61F|nr:hypothetical protein [Kibdelosporangium phytohabitans]